MLPTGAPKKVVEAFNKSKVSVISKAKRVTKVKGVDVTKFNGVVLIDTKNVKRDDLKKMKKALKSLKLSPLALRECVPEGSLAHQASESEQTDAEGQQEVPKSALMKTAENAETETEAEPEAEPEQPAKIRKQEDSGNSASSVVVSSFMSIAAIATVAAFLL